jgi:hypothetical protein
MIESKVCSLELAKELRELGIEQTSIFVWEYYNDQCHGIKYFPYAVLPNEYNKFKLYSAFTSDELMELLPACVDTKINEPFNNFWLNLQKRNAKNIQYIINYHCDTMQFDTGSPFFGLTLLKHNIFDESLANCLAKMLIHLIKNGLIQRTTNE